MSADFLRYALDLDGPLGGVESLDPDRLRLAWTHLPDGWSAVLVPAVAVGLALMVGRLYGLRGPARWTWGVPVLAAAVGAVSLAMVAVGWWIGWPVALAAALAAAVALYRLGDVAGWGRSAAAGLRLVALLIVAAMLAGPTLVLVSEPLRGTVLVLVDDSASMAVADGGATSAESRIEQAKRALSADDAAFLRSLLERNRVRVMPFSAGLGEGADAASADDLPAALAALETLKADGAETDLSGAVIESLRRAAGRVPAAVVILSDGRATTGPAPAAAVARARAGVGGGAIPIYTVMLGDPAPRKDVVVHRADAVADAFVGDPVEVTASVSARGYPAGTPIEIRLVPKSHPAEPRLSGEGLPPPEPLIWPGGDAAVSVRRHFIPPAAGRYELAVEAAALPGEARADNNRAEVAVDVRDRWLRVLYVEGVPRWEYRYLFPLLKREKSFDDSCLLLSSATDFPQEGKKPLRSFPATAEELDAFDVVLLGDFDPAESGPLKGLEGRQLELLAEWVEKRGGGLALIAGERAGLGKWAGTPIGKLLPVEPAGGIAGAGDAAPAEAVHAFRPRLTDRGRAHPIFIPPGGREAGRPDGWESLPGMFRFERVRRARPAAEVLAEHPTERAAEGGAGGAALPLMVAGQFGRGPVLYLGVDETWRWRYRDGEPFFDAFWTQAIRWLGRRRGGPGDRPVTLRADRPAVRVGETVTLTAAVADPALRARLAGVPALSVRIAPAGDSDRSKAETIPLSAVASGDGSATFRGTWRPGVRGKFSARLDAVAELGSASSAAPPLTLTVSEPRAEDARPEADPETLSALQATAVEDFDRRTAAGESLPIPREKLLRPLSPADLPTVAALIPARTADAPAVSEPVWDSKLAMTLLLTALTAEWLIRKRMRLA